MTTESNPESTQMIAGVAAIVAYVLGPGLGSLIFNGLSRLGGAHALAMASTGTILTGTAGGNTDRPPSSATAS